MFIEKTCPRCEQNLHKTPGSRFVNCFFCEGYSFRGAERHEWFEEETRKVFYKKPQRTIRA